jgi:hypothetical protein
MALRISAADSSGQPLVGVERKHPRAGREIERPVFLRTESGPVRRHRHLRAVLARDVRRAIGACRVDDDDLVGERHRAKRARDRGFLVPWR